MMMPKVRTHANGRMTSPPKISSARRQARVVEPVITVRGSVSFTDWLSRSYSGSLATLLEVLADAVEDDDLVVHRVADHREDAADDEERDLEVRGTS